MQPLEKSLRSKLEKTIKDARLEAEKAAFSALGHLGVGEATPFPHLSEEERILRRRLRAHGRQLGDQRDSKTETQEISRLVEEVAYEHWHRMLFARFLAENNLLMYPDPVDPVAVTLEECEDLAADESAKNGWELASRYAALMLPQIFRIDSPVFLLELPPENQQKLERLVSDLPVETFTASDSLGWVYQFWQADNKDRINKSEVKIGSRELPAVTQLFTEPYMVSFLLDNSLGAWWAARRLTEFDFKNASDEEELRKRAAISGAPLDYLRFVRNDDGVWTPAAGVFENWPETLAELKVLDPCCGSGHFLVAAFLMLVPMRMELEGLSSVEAVDRVLKENIHGLELDQRCVELAAFALALIAWKYTDTGGYRLLPELNVACSGLSISAKKDEWLSLAEDNTNLRLALEELYKQFKDAPILGSLINPKICIGKGSLFELQWEKVAPLLSVALSAKNDEEKTEMGVVALGLAKAAELLTSKFSLIPTNVPYKNKGGLSEYLQKYLERFHAKAKSALETAFMERCFSMLNDGGSVALVLPQNWLFLKSYRALRQELLTSYQWNFLAWLGPGAFSTPLDVAPVLVSINRSSIKNKKSFSSLEISNCDSIESKSRELASCDINLLDPCLQMKNPDQRITHSTVVQHGLLGELSKCYQGLRTGDKDRFVLSYWEIFKFNYDWEFFREPNLKDTPFGGMMSILYWGRGYGSLHKYAKVNRHKLHDMHESGNLGWGKKGVAINEQGLKSSAFLGEKFDASVIAIFLNDDKELTALWAYASSADFSENIRKLDRKRSVTNATFLKIPFDINHWSKVGAEQYPNGLPKPYSDDPTQWIFHGHPCGSVIWDEEKKWTADGHMRTDSTVLQIAVARLLGYRWPAELDPDMELADDQREWVKKSQDLLSFADEDGIVCIPPVRGEAPASDRLLNLLAAAYVDSWNNDVLSQLLTSADHAGKNLESWLREKFFTQHCKLFQHRPFIWHIWDGLRDGFAALVNYHKLDRKNLETLIYTYLGDWISRQKQDMADGVDGAEEKKDAAESLKKKLELILEGETPYDIFVRWKPLEKQPIGWNPDLNDGIRLNIRPFLSVPDVAKKGAGILRDKPNIKWEKDRGKDVESAPWFHKFNGDRINDHHLTLEEKRQSGKGTS